MLAWNGSKTVWMTILVNNFSIVIVMSCLCYQLNLLSCSSLGTVIIPFFSGLNNDQFSPRLTTFDYPLLCSLGKKNLDCRTANKRLSLKYC